MSLSLPICKMKIIVGPTTSFAVGINIFKVLRTVSDSE